MKKIYFFFSIIASLIPGILYSQTVVNAEIMTNSWLKSKGMHFTHRIKTTESVDDGKGNILFSVVRLEPAGFVVLSNSTSLFPVIAYAPDGDFGKMESGNPLFQLCEKDISSQLAHTKEFSVPVLKKRAQAWSNLLLNETKDVKVIQHWPPVGTTTTGGWLTENWHQNAPYSDHCPWDNTTDLRSLAGCPSIAMASIVNFHKTTNQTQFGDMDDYYHNYAGRQFYIDTDCNAIDFLCFDELNLILDSIAIHYENEEVLSGSDKAALVFACGVAATQVYTSSGSGTFSVNQAFEAYQKFSFTTAELLIEPDTLMWSRLSQNMKDTLPAHLAVVDSAWSTGHNVIVDGYNTDNYYHLNFGWGGSNNAWYLLPSDMPYNLNVVEGVILDIDKNPVTAVSGFASQNTTITCYPNPANKSITFSTNISEEAKVRIEISDISGRLIMVIYNQTTSGGPFVFSWTPEKDRIKPGFYFCRVLTNDKQSRVVKFIME